MGLAVGIVEDTLHSGFVHPDQEVEMVVIAAFEITAVNLTVSSRIAQKKGEKLIENAN